VLFRSQEEQVKKDQEMIEKLKDMMEVSTRIRLDMMCRILKLKQEDFDENIFKWAKKFGFKVDGDYIVIENADVSGFLEALDEQFKDWHSNETLIRGKIE
jgi:hypothetical protein